MFISSFTRSIESSLMNSFIDQYCWFWRFSSNSDVNLCSNQIEGETPLPWLAILEWLIVCITWGYVRQKGEYPLDFLEISSTTPRERAERPSTIVWNTENLQINFSGGFFSSSWLNALFLVVPVLLHKWSKNFRDNFYSSFKRLMKQHQGKIITSRRPKAQLNF